MNIDFVHQHLFLEGIFLRYGFDFREYSGNSIRRRIENILIKYNFTSAIELLYKTLDDKQFFYEVLPMMTTTTTEFFRDPLFFKSLRENIVPILKTYPRFNIWIAGCSSGEEAYSLAILLKEEGIYHRSTIYATDINTKALKAAKEGIFQLESMQVFSKNYAESGGIRSPSEYYTADYGYACMDQSLKSNIVFSDHNLVTDNVFVEAHLILCRNVLIYFSNQLKNKTLQLFFDSLADRGILCLGNKESLRHFLHANYMEALDGDQKIYRKNNFIRKSGVRLC